jgi:hypothetical protein
MFRMLKIGLGSTVLIASSAYAMNCPVDRSSMYFTGNVQIMSGVLMKEYRCPQGHTAWSR